MSTKTNLVCVIAVFLGCCLSGGCYDNKKLKAFLLEPRAPVSGTEYRVLPPDRISITSIHVPEISGVKTQVRPDGKINLPLVGEVYVAGKTPKEIEEEIDKAAKEYYEQVDSTVEVVAYMSQRFYVFGQVGRPGPMPWTGRDTLLDVLAVAQPTPLAWPERIMIVRGDEPQVGGYATTKPSTSYTRTGVNPPAKGKPRKTMVINLLAMIESGDMANNILLLPNDVVYVQPNPLARVGLAIQMLLFPIRPAVEAVVTPAGAAAAAAP
jgi:protein involved in polysaccharide export with SLBB domain